jgi:hypothetical protein
MSTTKNLSGKHKAKVFASALGITEVYKRENKNRYLIEFTDLEGSEYAICFSPDITNPNSCSRSR